MARSIAGVRSGVHLLLKHCIYEEELLKPPVVRTLLAEANMLLARINWWRPLIATFRHTGPYAAVALLIPGGSLIALVLWAVRHRSGRSVQGLLVLGIALFASAQVAWADPAAVTGESPARPAEIAERPCAALSAEQAKSLGNTLFDRGAYQRAGECYAVAGDYGRANLAFLKAAGTQGANSARQLTEDRDQAKGQLEKMRQAVRRSWNTNR
jgi:hypothetical protein